MNKYRNCLAVALALFTASSTFANSPTDEISRAARVAGGADIKQLTPAEFLQGFRAVVIRVKQTDLPLYVSTAVKMRPDLAAQTTVAALNARPLDRRTCESVDAIIRAAVTAAPTARYAIAQAALIAQPASRECILAAAGTSEADLTLAYARRSDGKDVGDSKDYKQVADNKEVVPQTVAFNGPDIWDVGNIISINPGPGGTNVVSPCDPHDR
ncbi:MAG: hypothetical protein ACR2MF_10980 [Chthoniobacterales bacterium]